MILARQFLFSYTPGTTHCKRSMIISLAFLLMVSIIQPAATFAQQTAYKPITKIALLAEPAFYKVAGDGIKEAIASFSK
ncbi:MAG: hypothetical protein ABI863_23195 [Ginsengibacter sp.]